MKKLLGFLFLAFLLTTNPPATAQTVARPFTLPLPMPPGPSTWLFGQPYGNTTSSFNFGLDWYAAGQGMHFGIDLPMPCGTQVVAVGDGEVIHVDNLRFGAGPHNLLISHAAQGVVSLYGHLLERPNLTVGQFVQRGQSVGLSGDPDVTCDSRPHLHLEIRAPDYRTAYNPISYIDAPWHMLATVGSYNYPLFQQDLLNPRRWMSLEDQPDIQFGGRMLNTYTQTYPPAYENRPIRNAQVNRELGELPEDTQWQLRRITQDTCCAYFWWHPTDPSRLYVIDGVTGSLAGIFLWNLQDGGALAHVGLAPPPSYSPDGSREIRNTNGQIIVHNLTNGSMVRTNTGGVLPALSTDNQYILWEQSQGRFVPGLSEPANNFWVSELNNQNAKVIGSQRGGSARWMDDHRVLISTPQGDNESEELIVYDVRNDTTFSLGIWRLIRNVDISPGGKYLIFYRTFQENTDENGLYIIETAPNAEPRKLDWFGSWRWRDADSLYYLPFEPTTNRHTLVYYHIPTGETRRLTDVSTHQFTIANGGWDVSANGQQIVFQSADDFSLWLLEICSDC